MGLRTSGVMGRVLFKKKVSSSSEKAEDWAWTHRQIKLFYPGWVLEKELSRIKIYPF